MGPRGLAHAVCLIDGQIDALQVLNELATDWCRTAETEATAEEPKSLRGSAEYQGGMGVAQGEGEGEGQNLANTREDQAIGDCPAPRQSLPGLSRAQWRTSKEESLEEEKREKKERDTLEAMPGCPALQGSWPRWQDSSADPGVSLECGYSTVTSRPTDCSLSAIFSHTLKSHQVVNADTYRGTAKKIVGCASLSVSPKEPWCEHSLRYRK